MEERHIQDWAASLELCTDTYEETGQLRIHAHAFFKHTQKVYSRVPDVWMFRKSVPHRSINTTLISTVLGRDVLPGCSKKGCVVLLQQ